MFVSNFSGITSNFDTERFIASSIGICHLIEGTEAKVFTPSYYNKCILEPLQSYLRSIDIREFVYNRDKIISTF